MGLGERRPPREGGYTVKRGLGQGKGGPPAPKERKFELQEGKKCNCVGKLDYTYRTKALRHRDQETVKENEVKKMTGGVKKKKTEKGGKGKKRAPRSHDLLKEGRTCKRCGLGEECRRT